MRPATSSQANKTRFNSPRSGALSWNELGPGQGCFPARRGSSAPSKMVRRQWRRSRSGPSRKNSRCPTRCRAAAWLVPPSASSGRKRSPSSCANSSSGAISSSSAGRTAWFFLSPARPRMPRLARVQLRGAQCHTQSRCGKVAEHPHFERQHSLSRMKDTDG